jgi:hypothetical protein
VDELIADNMTFDSVEFRQFANDDVHHVIVITHPSDLHCTKVIRFQWVNKQQVSDILVNGNIINWEGVILLSLVAQSFNRRLNTTILKNKCTSIKDTKVQSQIGNLFIHDQDTFQLRTAFVSPEDVLN